MCHPELCPWQSPVTAESSESLPAIFDFALWVPQLAGRLLAGWQIGSSSTHQKNQAAQKGLLTLHIYLHWPRSKPHRPQLLGTLLCLSFCLPPFSLLFFFKSSKIVQRDGSFPLTSFGYQGQPSHPQGIDECVGWTCCLTQFVFLKTLDLSKVNTCKKQFVLAVIPSLDWPF